MFMRLKTQVQSRIYFAVRRCRFSRLRLIIEHRAVNSFGWKEGESQTSGGEELGIILFYFFFPFIQFKVEN